VQQQSWQTRPFTLAAVNVYGTTVFSQAQLSRYFEQYLATEVDAGKLSKIADGITEYYRQEGYLLSYATVPTQTVEAGMVRLNVVEGRIDAISVEGAGAAQRAIETIAAPLVNGAPLKSSDLERVTGLIRDFPGITVQDIAVSPSEIAGRYTLKIKVIEHRVRAFSYADNRATNGVGQGRAYSSFALSSVFIQGDELRGDVFGIPGIHSRFLFGQALVSVPVGHHGLRLAVWASKGDQYLRSSEHFRGKSDNVSAQISYPLLRTRVLTLVGKASMTDFRSIGTHSDTVGLRDHFRVARFAMQFANESDTTRFAGELSLSRGLGFGGMTHVGDPLASRRDASGMFTKVVFTLDVAHALGQRFALRGVASAQYSDRPLLSGEEFSLGGNRIGRAFDFNALTGDRGAGAGAELSYRLGATKARRAELFGFADEGFVSNLRSSAPAGQTHSIASVGIGSRITLAGNTMSLEAALPISGQRHKPHLFVSIIRSF
jgi:hemolysin activation/secretion protein